MKYLLIDTCVWIDLAKSSEMNNVSEKLQDIIAREDVQLLVPEIVISETKNKIRSAVDEHIKDLQIKIKSAKETNTRLITDYNISIPNISDHSNKIATSVEMFCKSFPDTINKILSTLENNMSLKHTDEDKILALDTAIHRKAPQHRGKNNIADSLIIISFSQFIKSKQFNNNLDEAHFITHNIKDFSQVNGDNNKIHPELEEIFPINGNTHYHTNIADFINKILPLSIPESTVERVAAFTLFDKYCPSGEMHDLFDIGFRQSIVNGQLSFHKQCKKCGEILDTLDFYGE